jgi:hypothetical protein
MRYGSILALLLASLSGVTARAWQPGELETEVHYPAPSEAVMTQWQKNIFEGPEIWLFNNPSKLRSVLLSAGTPKDIVDKIITSGTPVKTIKETEPKLYERLEYGRNFEPTKDYVYKIPPETKQKISNYALRQVYGNLAEEGKVAEAIAYQYTDDVRKELARFKIPPKTMDQIIERMPLVDKRHWLILTPEMKKLGQEFQTWAMYGKDANGELRAGLNVKISVSKDDNIAEIARMYAGERDPKPIERYLRAALKKSGKTEIAVPVQNILPKFVRENLNTYRICHGAECRNAAISATLSNAAEAKSTPKHFTQEETISALKKDYRYVGPEEKLKTGDLLLYITDDFQGKPQLSHAAAYVGKGEWGNDIVFTKNGHSRINPYIFQTREQMEDIYIKGVSGQELPYKLAIFRRTEPGVNKSPFPAWLYKIDKSFAPTQRSCTGRFVDFLTGRKP